MKTFLLHWIYQGKNLSLVALHVTMLVILNVFLCFNAVAQQWQSMPMVTQQMLNSGISPGGEGGQWLRSINISKADPNFMLMATDVGGIYRSLDGGNNWQVCMVGWHSRGGNAFAIDPNNANRVIGIGANSSDYGSANGIYLSTNKGSTWSQILPMATGWEGDVEYDPTSYNATLGYCTVAYYSSPSGIWKTTDGGSNWNKVYDGFYNALLEVHPTQGYVYIASNNASDHGFWRSTNGGVSFTQYTDDYVTGLDVIDSQPDYVYISRWFKVWKSTDAGQTFGYVGTNFDNDGLPNNTPLKTLKVSPANPNNMIVFYEGDNYDWRRYYTNNGGISWQQSVVNSTNSFLPVNVRGKVWDWHPTNGNVIFAIGGDIITKSTDGGQTFNWSGNGENAVMVGGNINISPTSPNTVLLSFQDYNAAVTANGGTSWTYTNPSGNGWGGYCYGGYAVDANVMWLGNAPSWGGTRELKVSRNGGATWQVMTDGSGNTVTFSGPDIGYSDPNNANNCFASNWRSTDKGLTWTAMSGCDGVYTSNPSGAKELYGKKGDNIVRSTNGGASWTTVTTIPGGIRDIAYDHVRNRLYVASEDQLKMFENGSLSVVSTPVDQYGTTRVATVAVDPVDPSIVYAGNHRDIYACNNAFVRSTDAGQNWQNLTVNSALAWGSSGGPHEVMSIRVHPVTRYAWTSGQCFGMWKIGPPSSSSFNGIYKITAKHSGKALDVAGVSHSDGANVHQWEYVGGANQQWRIEPLAGGYYKITANHSGKSLDVQDFSTSDGGNIQQWAYGGSNNQQWQLEQVEPGYYRIISRHSGKALDVASASSANGANVIQWASHSGDNQRWAIEYLSSSSAFARTSLAEDQADENSNKIIAYPNPATTTVTIETENGNLKELIIFNAQGQEVLRRSGLRSGATIHTGHFVKGIYLLKGKTIQNKLMSGKLIIQ